MTEAAMIPYSAESQIPARRVLVLAPHPDDEVFGCGGAVAGHVAAGIPVSVVILTDGGLYGDAETRFQESRMAAQVLGYGTPEFWRLPDRGLEYGEALVGRIVETIGATGADLLYAPSLHEIHPDHSQLAMAAVEAVRRVGGTLRLAQYEVGVPLVPNLLLDITQFRDIKRRAMDCFVSQLERQRYDEHITALNQYRTYTLPPNVKAAEAYSIVSAESLRGATATEDGDTRPSAATDPGRHHLLYPAQPDALLHQARISMEMSQELAGLRSREAAQREMLDETARALDEARRTIDGLCGQVQHVEARMLEQARQREEMLNSTSWKVTRPLRWLSAQLRKWLRK